jgi:hypothetical protein
MLSCSNYSKQIHFSGELPASQRLQCQQDDTYRFVRKRLGSAIITSSGEQFGPYLYRNTRNNVIIASWEKPNNSEFYSSYDIGMNADALIYYKNE